MTGKEIITKALKENRNSLTEAEAKVILREYGVPVVTEHVAATIEEAVQQSADAGFPVVLKGLGAALTHKTEKGLVKLALKDTAEVRAAAQAIREAAGSDLEGFLVQPMILGKREFVAGMFCDAQFGPVIMFGLGGIFTEALNDTAFILTPVSESDAVAMSGELRSSRLLGPFRGEKEASQIDIAAIITGLSRLSADYEEITEVDINPVIIQPDGTVVAVDALIILGKRPPAAEKHPPVDAMSIGALFYPRSIAFIGASATVGKWGHTLITNTIAGSYRGKIYCVNPKEKIIAGRQVYPALNDIDEKVDLAVVTIPAKSVIDIIPQMRDKGITKMLLITSGFSEVGDEGRRLERELVAAAREAGILILGPNTMGICNPHWSFFCTGTHVRPAPGGTALIAQSGNLGTQLLAFADEEGIGIRGFCGSGNEAMIRVEDFIEGFESDDLTTTIVLYVESIKDSRRFFEVSRRVGMKKPIILLKGGRTDEGNRAAASHTGAMASNIKVFTAACRQSGIILAEQPMDLLDLSACFSYLPLPKGNRVGLVTLGGGWGVVATDLCVESGLIVPSLSDGIIAEINKILPPFWSKENPVDLVGEFHPAKSIKVLEELVKWDECDAIIHLGVLGRLSFVRKLVDSAAVADPAYTREQLEGLPKALQEFDRKIESDIVTMMEKYRKPIIGVSLMKDEDTRIITGENAGPYRCISFLTPERAVKSLARMYRYRQWLEKCRSV